MICSFPACPHPARASGLCAGHFQQKRRQIAVLVASGEKPEVAAHMYRLEPLRPRNDAQPMQRLTVRVSAPCIRALSQRGPTRTRAAQAVLEQWSESLKGVNCETGGCRKQAVDRFGEEKWALCEDHVPRDGEAATTAKAKAKAKKGGRR